MCDATVGSHSLTALLLSTRAAIPVQATAVYVDCRAMYSRPPATRDRLYSNTESKVYLRKDHVGLSSRERRRHGCGRRGGRSPDCRVASGGPEGRRDRRNPREHVRQAPEGVQIMPHAHKPCTCKPCTRMHTKERVSPENTSASRTNVEKKYERERAPKRVAPTLLRTPSQIPPESLPCHCRGTAVALPWHCRARRARARCARRARQLKNNTTKRGSNPGPRAGRPGRSPLGSPAGPSISSSSSIQIHEGIEF